MRETLNLVHDLTQRGIFLRTLGDKLAVDTSDPGPGTDMAIGGTRRSCSATHLWPGLRHGQRWASCVRADILQVLVCTKQILDMASSDPLNASGACPLSSACPWLPAPRRA